MNISDSDFSFFTGYLKENSGYHLVPEKKYLLESRLRDVIKKNNMESISEIVTRLKNAADPCLAKQVIESMTVNETYFFRDKTPFEILENNILPVLLKEKKHIRIWSGACSTGQEPYSIAIVLENYKKKNKDFSYEIIASDINDTVIEKAKKGVYSAMEVKRGLPCDMLDKFFVKTANQWQISQALRNAVEFKTINLKEPFCLTGDFDIVFLRNVMIYFDDELKACLIKKIASVMKKDSYLFLGASEAMYDNEFFARLKDVRQVYTRV